MKAPYRPAESTHASAEQADSATNATTWRLWVVATIAALCGCLFGLDLGGTLAQTAGVAQNSIV